MSLWGFLALVYLGCVLWMAVEAESARRREVRRQQGGCDE